MAQGFGCMVVGPAGSGKVITIFQANNDSRHSVTCCKNQGSLTSECTRCAIWIQRLRSSSTSVTLVSADWLLANQCTFFRYQRSDITRRCSGRAEIWPEWRSGLLYGVLDRECRLVDWRAKWVCRGFLHPFWLSRPDRALLSLGCHVAPGQSNLESWISHQCCLLRRWDLHQWAFQVHLGLFHCALNNDSTWSPSPQCADESWQAKVSDWWRPRWSRDTFGPNCVNGSLGMSSECEPVLHP